VSKIVKPGKNGVTARRKEVRMAKRKSVKELDGEIERLKRQVEIQKLKKELQKGGKK
jgi:polyhydroxyalkanoate synthesis regulator phasin